MIELLFPRRCPVCMGIVRPKYILEVDKKTMPKGIGMEELICPHCYEKLSFVEEAYCLKCGLPLKDKEQEYCASCKIRPHYFDENRGMMDYSNPYADRMMWELKYKNKKEYADFIGLELARRYGRSILMKKCEAIVPVPVHPAKKKIRGYNQAEVVARQLSQYMDIPLEPRLLFRTKKTAPQKELTATQRFANLKMAFGASNEAKGYKNILLIDDIYTTGATLDACSLALKEKGLQKIYGLTCCIGHGYL